MKIAVLAGGLSPERNVSLTSGSLIANALSANGHRVALLDVYKNVEAQNVQDCFKEKTNHSFSVEETHPDLEAIIAANGGRRTNIGDGVLDVCRAADVVFLALHGAMGENGQLQATLDNYGIRYTGSGYVGSALAMDKDLAKRLLRDAGVRTPDWVYVDPTLPESRETILSKIGLPCVIKPTSCGSSVGVTIVENESELDAALDAAAPWGDRVLAEKKINGRELTVGILDGKTLPIVEIIPNEGFYDYKNKYQGNTREVCPAEISKKAAEATLRGFEALRLRGYARFDYILDEADKVWCLEANTLPGMTPLSLLPMAAQAAGISYEELCEKIIEL